MTDSFESRVADWLRDADLPDAGEVSRLARFAASMPRRRAMGFPSTRGMVFAAAVGVAAIAILGAGFLLSSRLAPATRPSYSIITSDPRFAACSGSTTGVVAAFPVAHASEIRTHIPRMGISPELDTPEPAFVIVFDESHHWVTFGRLNQSSMAPATPAPNHVDVCVWLGDLEHGDFMSYGDVDITGMLTVLPWEASATWPPAEVGPAASCEAMPRATTVVTCATAFAIGAADARVDSARIWLTTLSAVNTALKPDHLLGVAGDTTVWLIVYDGSRACCPANPDSEQRPGPGVQATRWLLAVDAMGRFSYPIYFLDWRGKEVPASLPASGASGVR